MQQPLKNWPLIIAHRGDSRNAPENTLAAFRMALEKGADGVEFDVRLARDGVPVVIHDHNLKRTGGGGPERVSELTAAELAVVDAGSWFNRKFPERAREHYSAEHVPTLGEVMDVVSRSTRVYIELKCDKHDDYARLAAEVVATMRNRAELDRIVIKSFNLATLPIVKSLLPEVTTAALFAPSITRLLRRNEYIIDLAREAAADELSLHTSLATRHLSRAAVDAGMPVTIWTTDNPVWVERARQRSIGAIITDDPGLLLRESDR